MSDFERILEVQEPTPVVPSTVYEKRKMRLTFSDSFTSSDSYCPCVCRPGGPRYLLPPSGPTTRRTGDEGRHRGFVNPPGNHDGFRRCPTRGGTGCSSCLGGFGGRFTPSRTSLDERPSTLLHTPRESIRQKCKRRVERTPYVVREE